MHPAEVKFHQELLLPGLLGTQLLLRREVSVSDIVGHYHELRAQEIMLPHLKAMHHRRHLPLVS